MGKCLYLIVKGDAKNGTQVFSNHMMSRAKFYLKRSKQKFNFQGLKWGIVYFSSTNTAFGDTAKIEFVYLATLCSDFAISYKGAKLRNEKFHIFSQISKSR